MDLGKADKTLRNLKPRATAFTVALGDGILCRVAPNGTKTLELRARLLDKVTRWPLGHYPSTTIADAVARASGYRAMLKDGLSPKVAAQRAAAEDTPRNVREAVARFIDGHINLKLRPNSAREAARLLRVEVLPELGEHPLAQLQRTDLTALIERKFRQALRAKDKGIAANRLAAAMGKLFGWCATQGWCSPDLGMRLPKPAVEKPKARTLTAPELSAGTGEGHTDADDEGSILATNEAGVIWNLLAELAATGGGIPNPHVPILQLLAITGCRCSEIARLTTASINLTFGGGYGAITITDGKTDASNRTLPMTNLSRAIIEAQMAKVGKGLLFPSARAGTLIPSNEISRSCRKLVTLAGVAPFTPHDLRRTAISIMAEAGVDGDIRRRVTGHQATDAHGKIYDRAQRFLDMRGALLDIERHYTNAAAKAAAAAAAAGGATTAPGNVVALRRAK